LFGNKVFLVLLLEHLPYVILVSLAQAEKRNRKHLARAIQNDVVSVDAHESGSGLLVVVVDPGPILNRNAPVGPGWWCGWSGGAPRRAGVTRRWGGRWRAEGVGDIWLIGYRLVRNRLACRQIAYDLLVPLAQPLHRYRHELSILEESDLPVDQPDELRLHLAAIGTGPGPLLGDCGTSGQ
jgi:hypothetical protein